eukprot:CAMPEP_0176050946 /NCGR_PEP_ID=MMETSP0120_2-20121206/25326_1 /TAXON_ID=160619 /ORGANISM="Kryptoperidinium foliaceum, Strain CCMP 1326" /LENGTH=148 /DNA_ID=CAMNT_0017384385 /DNA_START=84 /DNA_END=530 /DNA_ORIENTATION=+
MSQAQKMTQAELLEQLSPPPFNQSKAVPKDATLVHSPEERWWRSDSPRGDEFPDGAKPQTGAFTGTQGALGTGQRSGPGKFVTMSQTGSGTAAHFKEDSDTPHTVPGYGGHIAGKIAGNVIGGTFQRSNEDAVEHLKTTAQATKFPGA